MEVLDKERFASQKLTMIKELEVILKEYYFLQFCKCIEIRRLYKKIMRGAIMPYLLLTRFEIDFNICSQIRYSKELQILGLLRPLLK